MEVKFDMTTRYNVIFGCMQAKHAQDVLLANFIDGSGQHISQVQYRNILRYRLMIQLF